MISLAFYWYSSQPKSWDAKSIACVSATVVPTFNIEKGEVVRTSGFQLRFVLINNTNRDYTLPQSAKLFRRHGGTQALDDFDGKLEHPFVIPAHERAQLTIQTDYSCRNFDLASGHESERDQATCIHDAFDEWSDFVALDYENKVRLNLLKPVQRSSGKDKEFERSKPNAMKSGRIDFQPDPAPPAQDPHRPN